MFCFSPLNSEALDIAQAKPHSTKARKAVLTSRAMPPIFKSRIGHGGLSTELQDGTAELYETSIASSVESDVQEPTSMIGAVGGGQMPFFPQKVRQTNMSEKVSQRCCSSGWPRLLALPDPLPWWCHWSYWWNDGSHEPLESFHEERWEGPNCRISKWSLREMARMKTWAGLNKTLSRMPKMRRTRRTVWKNYKNSCYACIEPKRSFAFMSLSIFHVKHVGHVVYHQCSMWHMWQMAMWLMWLMWSGLES